MLKVDHIGKLFTTTYRIALHKHDLWEVVYYSSGHGFVQIGNEQVEFKEGDVFILPPKLEHSDWAEEGFQDIFFTFHRCELSADTFYRFEDNNGQAILHLLNMMYEAYVQNEMNRENIINLAFDMFFQYAYVLSDSSPQNKYVECMKNAIISNLANQNFSINEIIKDLHLNINYARDLFVKHVGFTPLQYLMEKRLEYAKQLLVSRSVSNYSVREIAYMCGFSDPYYFSRSFHKHVGCSPTEWEKRNRKEE